MRVALLFLFCMPYIFSFSIGGIVSSALDFVPVVGNVKSLGELFIGKDLITGEELSYFKRRMSFVGVGVIPGGNYLKNSKHLKNGLANKVQKIVSNSLKAVKAYFKGSRD